MSEQSIDNYSGVSVTEVAYRRIKDLIHTNRVLPGAKLNKRIIAETLQLSSTPITLALKRLWGEGFIAYRSRIGFFVKNFSSKELIEFFELRASLESVAVRLLIENNSKEQLKEIIEYWDTYEGTSDEDYVNADNTFHEKIVSLSNNSLIIDTWMKIGCNVTSNQKGLQSSIDDSQRDHKAIISAIQKNDVTKAQLLMTEHFMNAAYRVKQTLKDKNQPQT